MCPNSVTHKTSTWLIVLGWAGLFIVVAGCKLASEGISALPLRIGPLDEETLEQLRLSTSERSQARPGDTLDLEVGLEQCCYFFEAVPARVHWSVSPQEGASIDSRSGVLSISPEAKAGAVYRVEADIEGGRRVLSGEIFIYTPEANPLVGVWHEQGRTDCASGALLEPQEPIRELVFKADGTFTVTWAPFEIYHDYWGAYTFDPAVASLSLQIDGGNYVPTQTDLEGGFTIDEEGRLGLQGIWLGERDEAGAPACGHLFVH